MRETYVLRGVDNVRIVVYFSVQNWDGKRPFTIRRISYFKPCTMYKKILPVVGLLFFFLQDTLAQTSPEDQIRLLREKLSAETKTAVRAGLLSDLCWSYISISIDSSLKYGQMAIKEALKAGDRKILAQARNDFGIALMLKGDYRQAMASFMEAKAAREQLGDREGVASLDLKMGNLYFKMGQADSAMHYYTVALGFFEREGKDVEASVILGNIGSTYYGIKAYDKALSYSLRSLALQKKTGRQAEAAGTLVNIGNIHFEQKDTTRAIEAYREAEEVATAAQNNSALAASLNNLSNIYLARGNFSEAKSLVSRAIGLRETLGEVSELSSAQLTLAIILNTEGDYRAALNLLRKIKTVFEENDSMERLSSVYMQLARAFGGLHQTDSLNHYLSLYGTTVNRLTEKEMLKNSADMEARYQSEKKDAELEKSRLEIRERNFLLAGSAALLVLLGVIAGLVMRGQRRKNLQQQKEHVYVQALARAENENRLKEQRIGISRELHDNIGSYLTFLDTSIKNLDAETPKVSRLRELTAETIAELRKTVWLINKPNVNIQEWAVKLADLYRRIPQVEVSWQDLPENIMLNTQQATSLLRVVQESVNNALKHSGSERVEICAAYSAEALHVRVSDQGKGFNAEDVTAGFGLRNMSQRMEETGGRIEVLSREGEGTRVEIALPLRAEA